MRQAQATISAAEFAEWLAYSRLDPFSGERGDLQAAIIASTIANVHRGKNQQPFRLADFMLVFGKPKQTWQDMKNKFKAFKQFNNHFFKVKKHG